MKKPKTVLANFNEKKATCKMQKFNILLAFLLIIIALLTAVSIYYYLIKYQTKRKHLLPFHDTNNELREVLYQKCIVKMERKDKLKEIKINNRSCYYFDDIDHMKIVS